MSKKIKYILEVIEEVRESYPVSDVKCSVTNIRRNAVNILAKKENIRPQSIFDKFTRKLKPEITSVKNFDKYLTDWLLRNSNELKEIVLKHSDDNKDIELVNKVFQTLSKEDILLAEEFDYNDLKSEEYREAKPKLRLHLIRERNRSLIYAAKKLWSDNFTKDIYCSVCAFSFNKKYGEISQYYIEAHHITPLSELTDLTIVTVKDLAPLCSNCHSMIHKRRPWLSIDELKYMLN